MFLESLVVSFISHPLMPGSLTSTSTLAVCPIWLIPDYMALHHKKTTKIHGLSPRANYTDRATAAYRRSDCQLLRIEGATWSV
jgi:hypothetical protein